MVPVLGFPSVDRTDRFRVARRADSPSSHNSMDSTYSKNSSPSSHTTPPNEANPSYGQVSQSSNKRSNTNSDNEHPNNRSSENAGPYDKNKNLDTNEGSGEICIEDYCLGTPSKIGQSHTGAVELSISLQEKAIFLPTVKRSGRSERARRQSTLNSRSHRRNTRQSSVTDSVASQQGDLHNLRLNGVHEAYAVPPEDDNDDELSNPEAGSPLNTGTSNSSNQIYNDSHTSAQNSGSHNSSEIHSSGSTTDDESITPCSTLRGSVLLKLARPMKIKEVGVSFYCISRTLWNLLPQTSVLADSTLPNTAQVEDAAYLGIHHWDFVPLEQFGTAQSQYDKSHMCQSATLIGQDLYGADVALLKDQPQVIQERKLSRVYNSQSCQLRDSDRHPVPVFGPLQSQPRKLKPSTVQSDGVLFPAGSYIYNFTLLVDAKTPGSVQVPNGEVKFVISARVARSGAFSPNVYGQIEVDVVRAPSEGSSESAMAGPLNDAVLLSRVWEDSFVYSLNLDGRNITLDVPTKVTLKLLPLACANISITRIQMFVSENVTYIYSPDTSIRYVDNDFKLLLYEKVACPSKNKGNLLNATDVTSFNTNLTLCSEFNKIPHKVAKQPFLRGRFGEMRFLKPDVKGPYVRVKHLLQVVIWVKRGNESRESQDHVEVKLESPICVQSRHCVAANIRLPTYTFESQNSDEDHSFVAEQPPSFDDAMAHELLGPPGIPAPSLQEAKES